MSTQISFLPKIDRKETQRRVEEALETTRIYKQIGFVRRQLSSTSSYEPRFHGPTNKTSDPAGDIATWNVDQEERLRKMTERVEWAVSRLPAKLRMLIQKRYLESEDALDYVVCSELNMSKRTYEREKPRAIYMLAFMLKLEVIDNDVA
ncbi:ArpU family phage packaging/lysis transcriptional regulator [Brevibacillus fulvus]|uniref:ArpU family phage transcriptional regulator n=1 Tax=Brevibacillus fulvus TaxID=1125967 RepID=A0A938Y6Q5_9BACL|nr:ArpU family phage packaging/lysis transcriptional regulator [Brevibacillus fulvus]MBM7592270.1 ArpU family phage transcriptional regulator [Brevibacillus fulvus]